MQNRDRGINISELLNRLNDSINNIIDEFRNRILNIVEQTNDIVKTISNIEDVSSIRNNIQRLNRNINEILIGQIERITNSLLEIRNNIETGNLRSISPQNVINEFNDLSDIIGRNIGSIISTIKYDIENKIRDLSGIDTFIPINELINQIESGNIRVNENVRRQLEGYVNLYKSLEGLESNISYLDTGDIISDVRRNLNQLNRIMKTDEFQRYIENINKAGILQTEDVTFPEFTLSNLSDVLNNLGSNLSNVYNTVNEYIEREFNSLSNVFENINRNISGIFDIEMTGGELGYVITDIDTSYIRELSERGIENILGERFLRREVSDRLRENIRQLSSLSLNEIKRYTETFGRYGEILTPILDIQPFDIATGGDIGLDFANGIRRVNTLFGNISVMLSTHLSQAISEIEKSLEQAYTREPFLYTEKFLEEAEQTRNRLARNINESIRSLGERFRIDIGDVDVGRDFEDVLNIYNQFRQRAIEEIRRGADFREFYPVVELGNMLTTYRELENQIRTAQNYMRYINFPELMSSFDRFIYGFVNPLQEGLSQLGNFTIGSLSWIAMFGLSNAFFLASTMLPMEQSYRAYFPIYQALGGLFGFTQLFDRLQDFTYWLPWNMENLAQQYTTLTGLMGTPTLANRMLQTALEISRVEPIQFEEAMSVITSLSLTPQIRYALQNPEFQRQVFNAVQLLSILVPEQGIEGAIFAIREYLNNQFLSIQRRFNIEIEAIASYAGVSVADIKGADPVRKIEILSRALENLFGGNEELLLMRGATLMTQVNNVIDTLNNSLIRPLITLRSSNIAEYLNELVESGDLQRIAPQFYRRALDISQREQIPLTQIVQDIYGTPYGVLSLTMTGINTFLGEALENLNIGEVLGKMFINVSKNVLNVVGDYLSIDRPSPAITRYYGELLLNTISQSVSEIVNNTQLSDVIGLISSFVGNVLSTTFRNLTVGILKSSITALGEIPNVVAQSVNESIYGSIYSIGNTVRTITEPFISFTGSLFDSIEQLGRIASGRYVDGSISAIDQFTSSLGRLVSGIQLLGNNIFQFVGDTGQFISTLASFTMPVYTMRTSGLIGATLDFIKYSQLAYGFSQLSEGNILEALQNFVAFGLFNRLRIPYIDFSLLRDIYQEQGLRGVFGYLTSGIGLDILNQIRYPLSIMSGIEYLQTGDLSYAITSMLLSLPSNIYSNIFNRLRNINLSSILSTGFRTGLYGLGLLGLEYLEGYFDNDLINIAQGLLIGDFLSTTGFGRAIINRFGLLGRLGLYAIPATLMYLSEENKGSGSILESILGGAAIGAGIGAYFGGVGALIGAGIGAVIGLGRGIWNYIKGAEHNAKTIESFIATFNRDIVQMYSQMMINTLSQISIPIEDDSGFTTVSLMGALGKNVTRAIREYIRGNYEGVIEALGEEMDTSINNLSEEAGNVLQSTIIDRLVESGLDYDTAEKFGKYIFNQFTQYPRLLSQTMEETSKLLPEFDFKMSDLDVERYKQFIEDVLSGRVNLEDIEKALEKGGVSAYEALQRMGFKQPEKVDIEDARRYIHTLGQVLSDNFEQLSQINAEISQTGDVIPTMAWSFLASALTPKLPELPSSVADFPKFIQEWSVDMNRILSTYPSTIAGLTRLGAMIDSVKGGIPWSEALEERITETWDRIISSVPESILIRKPNILFAFAPFYRMGIELEGYGELVDKALDYYLSTLERWAGLPEEATIHFSIDTNRNVTIKAPQVNIHVNDDEEEYFDLFRGGI